MRTSSRTMIGLLLGAAAITPIAAQDQGHDRGGAAHGDGGGGQHGGGNPHGGAPQRGPTTNGDARHEAVGRPAPMQQAAPRGAPGGEGRHQWQGSAPGGENRGQWRGAGHDQAGDRNFRAEDQNRNGRDINRGGDRPASWDRDHRNDGNRGWNRDWRGDRRFGWQDYRNQHRDIYRLPPYRARYGYSYRRWYPGYRFDPWFYSANFWIADPFFYRLPPAYGPYRWVRYYNDAVLVDIRDGQIVDIIYSFFY